MQNLATIKNQLATSQELFKAFKTQLAKDFQQSNFSTDFIANLEADYNSIHRKIASELQRNEKNAYLMKLLNRVDISEQQLKRYLSEQKKEDPSRVIAELIIKRVLQKVVIKQYYKSNDNS